MSRLELVCRWLLNLTLFHSSMAKSSAPRKKYRPKQSLYQEKIIQFGQDDSVGMTYNAYQRLEQFVAGNGVKADQTTLRIRLTAGAYLAENFDEKQDILNVLHEALEIVMNSAKGKGKDQTYSINQVEAERLGYALTVIDGMIQECSLAQEVLAYKAAEDAVLFDADKYEYVVRGAIAASA